MADNPAEPSSSQARQHSNLHNVLLDKQFHEKKKKGASNSLAWNKIRENVADYSSDGTNYTSSTSSVGSSKASSRSNTPRPYIVQQSKKTHTNPFIRHSSQMPFDNCDYDKPMTLANATLVAAQAAKMTEFTRNFRHAGHGRQNGGIYAASTAVQQDIYKLERNIDKLLLQMNAHPQHLSFTEASAQQDYINSDDYGTQNYASSEKISALGQPPSTGGSSKKSVFHRQLTSDQFPISTSATNLDMNEDAKTDISKISLVMSALFESIKKHKLATRLPMTGEILAVLAVPFDKPILIVSDCLQALDMFDYIRNRFLILDTAERFEQILFCCRLLASREAQLKKRVLGTLVSLLEPCASKPDYLPSTPTAYHSFTYTLTLALTQLNIEKSHSETSSSIKEENLNDTDMKNESIKQEILNIMDKLASGELIPIKGEVWQPYHSSSPETIPEPVAKLCVVEALLKSLMVRTCNQVDPYQETLVPIEEKRVEAAKDWVILKELLNRFWIEPETNTRPAYFKIIFLLSDLACETFFMSKVDDLKKHESTVSLLLPLVLEKLSPSKLQKHLAERNSDETQKTATSNVIAMLLALLSICSLQDQPSNPQPINNLSSPNLSPPRSYPEFLSEAQSANSLNTNDPSDATTKKVLLALKGYVEEFWNSGYKEFILLGTESMHQDALGIRVACTYQNLVFHINPVIGEEIARKTLPSLFKRLVDTYPPAIPELCQMLFKLSKRFKSLFYKPVVSCVASDDEEKVTSQLNLITCLRRYLSEVQFWMQDAEMINVLLLSDVGQIKKKDAPTATPQLKVNNEHNDIKWGSTTLGQCVIAAEFMWAVKSLRAKQKDPHRNMEEDETAKKFLIDIERRLAIFLTAKEKMTLVPMPLRIILCNIFIDIRFFCNTTHRPGWLTRVIDWAAQPIVSTPEHVFHYTLPLINPIESPSPNNVQAETKMPDLHMGHISDASFMFQRIHSLYLNIVDRLQFESNDMQDYGGAVLRPDQPPNSQSETDDINLNDFDTHSVEVPRHRRQQAIYKMYPISRSEVTTLTLDPPPRSENDTDGPATKLAKYRFENMDKINQDPFGSVFSLLVAVFTALSSNEFGRLIKPLWEYHLDDRNPQSFIPAAFLLMECGEKIPKIMIEVCTHDFYSNDPLRRLAIIQKHFSLSAFRFNVLGQEYIPISSRKRPFRGDGGALSTPFVPTDLGSNQFTLDEPRWMAKLKNASNFPIELKRQIQELGWDDDDNGEEHEALKKVLTPLALLPSLFLDEEDDKMNENENTGLSIKRKNEKITSITKIIIRRKRATTIHALTIPFLSMVDLLNDDYGGASNALRELLEYFLRDDPSLFLRAFLSDLGKFKLDRHKDMLTRLRYLVSMQHKLPPGFTHILFNYLTGMLKWLMRENKKDGLVLMTLIHPILAELALSTNDLSVRDLRKNKIEHLLVSTGRFWFTHEQPVEIFPRYLSENKTPFSVLDIPPEIFSVAMLRISHIQFLTNYLVRYPREVYAVKKTLQDYEPTPIPGNKLDARWTIEENYYPDISRRRRKNANSYIYHEVESAEDSAVEVDEIRNTRQPSQQQLDTEILSALRARVWLRFIDNLLNGLNKNYNDRDELENILQGINSIISEHNRDFGIIGQALILYTRVVTRFKRLFISNRGYTAFLPALFKVFCEADCFRQVRSAITFAWCRFYAVHEESFVFQMLSTLVPLILNAYSKSDVLGSWMTDNMFILMQAMHNPPQLGATSDVLGLQLQVELDDHERSIQERIDTASNPMTMPLSASILKPLARSVTVPIAPLDVSNYNNKPFELQNFVKLFLTIIAYDPGSLRAEQFVKVFRHMIPRFHKLPILKNLLDEGIGALIDVFARFSKNAKSTAQSSSNQTNSSGYQGLSSGFDTNSNIGAGNGARTESAQNAYGKQWQQNDRLRVKKEFVLLVHEYLKNEGTLTEVHHEKMAQIIRIVIRDYGVIKGYVCKTDWVRDYIVDCFHSMADGQNYVKPFKRVLKLIYEQYKIQWRTIDASDLYEGMAIVLEQGQGKPMYMHDIASILNEKFVQIGLTVATQYNWDADTKSHSKFCNSLARLIIAILENTTQDVLGEIEQQHPTPSLISNIIIPVCLQYNLQWDYSNMPMSNRFRPDPTSNWTRLLNYVSRACSQASLLKNKSSAFSFSHLTSGIGQTSAQDGIDTTEFPDIKYSKQTPQSIALLFSLSFVALKIILVRGNTSLNKLKGSWVQVAFFIKTALVFGQTLRYLKPKSGRSTPHNVTSPSASGMSPGGALSPGLINWVNTSQDARTSFSFTAPIGTGTIYDFTTWKFLQFATFYQSPLYVLLKDFIQEKLLELGSHSNNRSSFYSPVAGPNSSSGKNSFITGREGSATKWRSWGGRSSEDHRSNTEHSIRSNSSIGIIPQLNVQDTGSGDANNNAFDEISTCGLGLHIPSKSSTRAPPVPNSPSLSPNLHSEISYTESGMPTTSLHSPRQSLSTKHNKKDKTDRPTSSISVSDQQSALFNMDNTNREEASTVLHVLHAESITAMVHVQLSMGFKPALPWMATKSSQQLRPWKNREAVAKLAAEWQLLIQLQTQSDQGMTKTNSHMNSNINVPVTSLL